MDKRILIVDDDREIAGLIEIYLKNEGYQTTKAYNGAEALETIRTEEPFQLVVMDIMMPEMDGLEFCRRMRADTEGGGIVPILMLSAKAEDMDKIIGLMTGADDYMVKPFNPLELVARVKSLLRRSLQYSAGAHTRNNDTLELGGLTIDKRSHKVEFDGRELHLTSREFGILHLLASEPSRVYSAEEIFQHVWKERYYDSNNTVMVHISNLRDKLEQETGDKFIVTVWGVGYKIEG